MAGGLLVDLVAALLREPRLAEVLGCTACLTTEYRIVYICTEFVLESIERSKLIRFGTE